MVATKLWMSYDLGTLGDYEALYSWLDDHYATECGRNVAMFTFEYIDYLVEELREELTQSISLDRLSRIYVLFRDQRGNRTVGRFIKGRRKQAPWTGYGTQSLSQEDEDEAV